MHPELTLGEHITEKYYKDKYNYLKKYLFIEDEYINPNKMRISPNVIKNYNFVYRNISGYFLMK